ncbi:MAG: M48 family metalloprotease [Magnetococcales bacterium]|nr:M48 family metalloprotease [Magnetococcales bacterium]
MKNAIRIVLGALLLLAAPAGAGVLDQLQQLPVPAGPGGGSVIDGVGGMLGVDQKRLDLVKKGVQTAQALQPINEEAERALGETIAVEAFRRFGGLHRNEPLTRYLNLVGRSIAEVTDRPNLNYHFAILDSTEENAFAAPGGFVFVTLGLLRSLTSESELAGVLGHELAHINRKHMLNTLQRGSLLSNVTELSMAALDKDPKLLGAAVDQLSDLLFTRGLDKDLEFEADQYGLEYAQRAGYTPNGLRLYLQRLARKQGAARSVFFTTHPPVDDRLQRVERRIAGMPKEPHLAILQDRFKRNTGAM